MKYTRTDTDRLNWILDMVGIKLDGDKWATREDVDAEMDGIERAKKEIENYLKKSNT